MKKIMMMALLACATCAFAEETAPKAPEGGRAPGARAHQRQQLTPEQRKERQERFMAQMKARQEAVQAKVVEALKEAGLDEAKAKTTAEKIQKIYFENAPRRPGMGGPRRPRPEAK